MSPPCVPGKTPSKPVLEVEDMVRCADALLLAPTGMPAGEVGEEHQPQERTDAAAAASGSDSMQQPQHDAAFELEEGWQVESRKALELQEREKQRQQVEQQEAPGSKERGQHEHKDAAAAAARDPESKPEQDAASHEEEVFEQELCKARELLALWGPQPRLQQQEGQGPNSSTHNAAWNKFVPAFLAGLTKWHNWQHGLDC